MLDFTGKQIGDIYLKESKLALLQCNQYNVIGDNITVGTFFSGSRHSGEKYFSFTIHDEALTVKVARRSFFKKQHQILHVNDSKLIGYFEYTNWEWLNGIDGTMMLTNGEQHHVSETFGILTKSWPSQKNFEMSSETMRYSGDIKVDSSFQVLLTGSIDFNGKPKIASAVLGLFFIDRKFRKWVRNNID